MKMLNTAPRIEYARRSKSVSHSALRHAGFDSLLTEIIAV
jgi:hypothetical protein